MRSTTIRIFAKALKHQMPFLTYRMARTSGRDFRNAHASQRAREQHTLLCYSRVYHMRDVYAFYRTGQVLNSPSLFQRVVGRNTFSPSSQMIRHIWNRCVTASYIEATGEKHITATPEPSTRAEVGEYGRLRIQSITYYYRGVENTQPILFQAQMHHCVFTVQKCVY